MPLPGRSWSLASDMEFHRYTVADLREAFFSEEEPVDGSVYGFCSGSKAFGEFADAILNHPVKASVVSHQRTKIAANVVATVHDLYRHISKHVESKHKEGLAIVGAELDDDVETGKPRRMVRNAMSVGFIGYDFDSGQSPEEVAAALRKRGITFGMYSSHSHMKDGSTPKFRVIIPLRIPFDTSHYETREKANAVWKASYEAFGGEVGFEYDPAAKDITRLFNSPRHANGRPHFSRIYAGDLFDLSIIQPEDSKVSKAARKHKVKLGYDNTGEAYVADGNGVDFHLSLIGAGEGQLGFHPRIYPACCSYFATEGTDADPVPMINQIRETIRKADKGTRDAAAIERYMSDAYLEEQARNAAEYIQLERQRKLEERGSLFVDALSKAKEAKPETSEEDLRAILSMCVGLLDSERTRIFAALKTSTKMPLPDIKKAFDCLQSTDDYQPQYAYKGLGDGIKAMNCRAALVGFGTGNLVLVQDHGEDIWKTEAAATTYFKPWKVNGEALFDAWLEDERRRHFVKAVFEPSGCPPYLYNLWRGFAVEPKAGSWRLFQRHMLLVIADGDKRIFEWMMAWFAHLFQQPGEKPDSALVILGPKGIRQVVYFPAVQIDPRPPRYHRVQRLSLCR